MRILHTYLHASSFVNKDQAFFETLGTVRRFQFDVRKKYLLPLVFLQQFYHLLIYGFRTDIFICQFAGYHSFLPSLFAKITGKKSLIIAGGTDCVSFPGIGYGNFYRPILRDFTKWSYQLCSHICPKHDTLWFTEYHYDSAEPHQQGIKAFVPTIQDKYTVIRNGYDPEKWPLLKLNRKSKSFITVSGAFEYPFQVQLKGIDLILEAAVEFPDYHFTIAGVPDWKKLEVKSNNVTILPPIPHNDLHRIFNEHEYYLQLSMAEGFPNALCEAMLCGCTPIVSNVFSMPEITGNTEMAISMRNAHELTSVLKKANTPNESTQHTNRKLISERYRNTERTRELEKVIKRLVNQ